MGHTECFDQCEQEIVTDNVLVFQVSLMVSLYVRLHLKFEVMCFTITSFSHLHQVFTSFKGRSSKQGPQAEGESDKTREYFTCRCVFNPVLKGVWRSCIS